MSSALDHLKKIDNLKTVWKSYWRDHSRSAPGNDWITPKAFNDNLSRQLSALRFEIGEGYSFSPLRAIPIEKKNSSKKRLICIPTVRDRVVQRALLQQIEGKAKKLGIINEVSFGFVKDSNSPVKRGVHAARDAAIRARQENSWAFKADITAFFDRIPRESLIGDFRAAFSLKSLEPLIRAAINCEVDSTDPAIRRVLHENGILNGRGLRQGMPLSPVLSNFVLRDFDRAFGKRDYKLVRYADDLLVFANSEDECRQIEEFTISELAKLKLSLSETKTFICNPAEPVEFLGMDLGVRPGTKKYGLTISNKRFEEIRAAFRRYHDWSTAQNERLDVAKLFRRLEQMKNGYSAAYFSADNISDLNGRLEQWVQSCAVSIYTSIFGQERVNKLTLKQKQFLMLP